MAATTDQRKGKNIEKQASPAAKAVLADSVPVDLAEEALRTSSKGKLLKQLLLPSNSALPSVSLLPVGLKPFILQKHHDYGSRAAYPRLECSGLILCFRQIHFASGYQSRLLEGLEPL